MNPCRPNPVQAGQKKFEKKLNSGKTHRRLRDVQVTVATPFAEMTSLLV
jgi:hypothetical protein